MCGLGVRATCLQRVTDVTKTSVYEHELGVGFIWQIQQGRKYGDLDRTQRQQMECYVEAHGTGS